MIVLIDKACGRGLEAVVSLVTCVTVTCVGPVGSGEEGLRGSSLDWKPLP